MKKLQNINKELQGKSTYFQKLYEDRTNGILRKKEFLILMNKYKYDNEKLEERQKIVKKEISSTLAKKETVKTKKNIFKKYRHIEELSIEIAYDFIDKILIGSYDEKANSRDIKIIWTLPFKNIYRWFITSGSWPYFSSIPFWSLDSTS